MDKSSAQQWADFLKKIGYNATKKSIKEYIISHDLNWQEAWDYFVESNDEVKEAANANRIYGPGGIADYFAEVSYAKMRGTYPRRSHGHSIIVPRLKTIQDIKAGKEKILEAERRKIVAKEAKIRADQMGVGLSSEGLINKTIEHMSFGVGTIIGYYDDGKRGYLVVDFQGTGRKTLSYQFCLEHGCLQEVCEQ